MQRLTRLFFTIGLCSISLWKSASAQDGTFDATFGTGGREAFSLGSSPNFVIGAREMADGRLVIVADCSTTCIARLHTDGSFDQSFGPAQSGALVLANLPTANDYFQPSAMALLSDGRIVISGCIETTSGESGAVAI